MKKTVYFFGAGATKSIAPSAPLNKDLVQKALSDFSHLEAARDIQIFIEEIFGQRTDPPIDNNIWNFLDYAIQSRKSVSPKHNLERVTALQKSLLSLVIQEFDKQLAKIDTSIYSEFATKIKDRNSAIITTNYDVIIDRALANIKSRTYGAKFRTLIESTHDDPLVERCERSGLIRARIYNIDSYPMAHKIPLLKIHGSLNWLYCPKCDEVDISAFGKGSTRTVTGEYYCANNNCTNKYESLLITPTMFKNYDNRFIREVWVCAEMELINADHLVFIGYALKEEDYQIRCLLMKALLNKETNSYKKITIVEDIPNRKNSKYLDDVEEKYRSLFGSVEFKPIGFIDYVNQL